MRYLVVFVALIPFFVISLNPVFAMCANDPVNPNTPCDDLIETLILDSPQTQIEKIDDVLYYVSVPFDRYSSADKIIFQEVTFSPPYTFDPPRHTYTDVIFVDGSNETISILFDDPAFTKHVNPQAGFISRTSGSHFLVSVNLDELSPLEQFRYGIPLNKIQCKDSLILIKKYDGSPACVTLDTKIKLTTRGWVGDDMPILDWKKYITVSASRIDKSELENIAHIVKLEDLPQNDLLQTLLDGADGCKNETEICRISGGISVDRIYPFLTLSISDNDMYSVTLTLNKADDLLSSFDWNDSENLLYSVIQWDEKYYLLILSTFENTRTPDVKMNIVGTTHEPISLERGEILNYTVQVNTWATYGADAQIDLIAVQDTKDSGIDVWIEPNIITVPERSNATATLFIKAQDNANDGIYDIRVIGHANGKPADLYCRNTICPTVNIGNSAWSIRTFGSGTNMGIGGMESPENTFLELDLDKKEFLEGDIVEIKTYLINNSTEKIMFVPDRLLIKVIKAQDMGYYDNLYGIDAGYESDELLVLEPYSKTLLVRPFYWNQNTFENFDDEQRVDVRQHKMIAKFVGENYAWNGDTWFEIK